MKNKIFLSVALLLGFKSMYSQTYSWSNLSGAPTNGGKQDGIYFVNKDTGWVVNGSGRIYRTQNGGSSWVQQKNSAGTYFRAVAFKDAQTGFAGNVGTGYFPGVTDANPLYKTIDGGNSWIAVTPSITGVVPAGICAIQVVNSNVVYAAGRVGSPAVIIKSVDGGDNWNGINLSAYCQMILDIKFISEDTGYVFAGTNANITSCNARIIRTTDGGATWNTVYTSSRVNEMIWKAWFPSHQVGYATVQSYDAATTQRYVVKTTDGGLTWNELPLVNTGVREFGIGFVNDTVGWVGGESTGYQTLDGGLTWTNKNIGQYANKFTITNNADGSKTAYAVGVNVFKMTSQNSTGIKEKSFGGFKNDLMVYPSICAPGAYVSVALDKIKAKIIKSELVSLDGKTNFGLFNSYYIGTHESPFMFKLPEAPLGQYFVRFYDETGKSYSQKIIITN